MLLDTRFYKSLCSELLPSTDDNFIHHNPNGGKDADAQSKRFEHTVEKYKEYFIEEPPADIWHNVRKRQRLSDENGKTTDENTSSDEVDDIIKRPAKISNIAKPSSSSTSSTTVAADSLRVCKPDKRRKETTLLFKNVDNNSTTNVIVNNSTKWKDVVAAYGKKMKLQKEEVAFFTKAGYSVRYLRVSDHGDRTISSLALTNNGTISVFTDSMITINVRDQVGDTMIFRVKKSTKMEKVMNAYAQRRGVAAGALRFLTDSGRVGDEDTCASLELEDDDQIHVMLMQEGC